MQEFRGGRGVATVIGETRNDFCDRRHRWMSRQRVHSFGTTFLKEYRQWREGGS
jgi:hypothetical protein